MSPATTRSKPRARAQPVKRGPSRQRRHRGSPLRRAAPWLAAAAAAASAVLFVAVQRDGDNGGRTPSGPFVGGDLHTLVVDPAHPMRLFVGGHEAVATSADGGRTWTQVESLRNADAMGWAFSSTSRRSTVLVGDTVWMGGHPGLRRSTDGGRTFDPAGGELSSVDVHALGGSGGVLYAASPARGLLASTDDGDSWEVRSGDAGQGFMGAIVVDADDAEHLLAPDMQAGAVESTDGGRTWRSLGSPGTAMSVAVVGTDMASIIVAGNGEAARSDDGGRTWQRLPVPEGTMVVTAGVGGELYAAVLEGSVAHVSLSTDSGRNWRAP